MPELSEILILTSLVGALALCVVEYRKRPDRKRLLSRIALLAVLVFVLHLFLGFPKILLTPQGTTISKGIGDSGTFANWPIYMIVYAAMVAGMLSQYLYDWMTKALGDKAPFSWRSFLAPALLSPIIFVPLCGTLDSGANAEKGTFMLMLVAFENGFFFKSYFEERAKAARTAH